MDKKYEVELINLKDSIRMKLQLLLPIALKIIKDFNPDLIKFRIALFFNIFTACFAIYNLFILSTLPLENLSYLSACIYFLCFFVSIKIGMYFICRIKEISYLIKISKQINEMSKKIII